MLLLVLFLLLAFRSYKFYERRLWVSGLDGRMNASLNLMKTEVALVLGQRIEINGLLFRYISLADMQSGGQRVRCVLEHLL